MPWTGAGGGGSFPKDSVVLYADLPISTGSNNFYFVQEPKNNFWVKNPRGFYQDTATGYINATLKVQAAMDSGTFINWTDWSAYISASNGINVGDRVIYSGIEYSNKTGVETSTAPDLDTTNWYSYEQLQLLNDEIEIEPTGDDRGVHFKNQVSVEGELIAGKDSYPVPIAFHCDIASTTGKTITGATDITAILQSDTGSFTGLFGGTTAGSYVLIGSPVTFEGAKVKYNAVATVEPANITAEYYINDIEQWSPVAFMGTNSNYPQESHGWNIAMPDHTAEQIFFGFDPLNRTDPDPWEVLTFNINGTNYTYKWARYRVVTAITGDPQVEQIKLHTDRIEHESTGTFRYGRARTPVQLFAGVDNTTPNSLIDPIDENVSYTPTFTAKYKDNEFANNRDDGFGVVVNRKFGLDSSVPLMVAISFYVKGTSTGNVEFTFRSSQVTDGYIYNGTNPAETSTKIVTIATSSNLERQTTQALVPINQLESNSAVVIEVSRLGASSGLDTLSNNVVITNVVVTGFIWKL